MSNLLSFELWHSFDICHLNFEISSLLGPFEEIDTVPFFQSDNRLFPIRSLAISSSQAFYLAQYVGGSYLEDCYLKEALNG